MASVNNSSLSKQVFDGTKWYIAMRCCLKGIGFVSSAFLARLLVPEDFGLVATALVIFGIISLLFEFGVNWALIQNNEATDEHFHTAWTVRLFQAIAVSTILAIASPYIAQLYGDSRIESITLVMAAASLISGFENIGTVKFQMEMQFSKDFSYRVVPKIISTITTIALAFYYKSYMALIVAALITSIIQVCASYLVISFRPKFSLVKFSEIWGFSQWMLVRNFANYISRQGDLLILASLTTTTNLGYYKWATELSFMAISEVQQPFSRALTPGLVKLKHDNDRLTAAYLKALSAMALVAVPVALGFGAISQELIPIFLGGGDKWLPVVPIINGLVFFAMSTALYGISGNLLTITGNVKYTAYISWFTAAMAIATLYPAYKLAGLTGIAYSRAIVGILTFFIVSFMVSYRCNINITKILRAVWRPTFSGITMYIALVQLSGVWMIDNWLLLVIKIALGATLYSVLTLLLWLMSGKPPTFESVLISRALNRA